MISLTPENCGQWGKIDRNQLKWRCPASKNEMLELWSRYLILGCRFCLCSSSISSRSRSSGVRVLRISQAFKSELCRLASPTPDSSSSRSIFSTVSMQKVSNRVKLRCCFRAFFPRIEVKVPCYQVKRDPSFGKENVSGCQTSQFSPPRKDATFLIIYLNGQKKRPTFSLF